MTDLAQPVFHPFFPIAGQKNRSSLRDSKELQGEVSTSKKKKKFGAILFLPHSLLLGVSRNHTAKGEEGDQNQARHFALLQGEGGGGSKMSLTPTETAVPCPGSSQPGYEPGSRHRRGPRRHQCPPRGHREEPFHPPTPPHSAAPGKPWGSRTGPPGSPSRPAGHQRAAGGEREAGARRLPGRPHPAVTFTPDPHQRRGPHTALPPPSSAVRGRAAAGHRARPGVTGEVKGTGEEVGGDGGELPRTHYSLMSTMAAPPRASRPGRPR